MCSMSKCLFYSEMRRGKTFLKTHHLAVKAGFVIPCLCAGSASGGIRQLLLCPAVLTSQNQVSLGQTATEGGLRCGSGLSSLSVSADVLRVSVSCQV